MRLLFPTTSGLFSLRYLYSVRVELSPSLKKSLLCMACKLRYVITYFMHFTLKYILILFITFSHECHAKTPHVRLEMPQEFHVPARGYRKRKLRLFVKRFFSEPRCLYSCIKLQKTISDYYFIGNNYCNRTSVNIIKTYFELPRDMWLTSHGEKCYSKVWNLRYAIENIWSS